MSFKYVIEEGHLTDSNKINSELADKGFQDISDPRHLSTIHKIFKLKINWCLRLSTVFERYTGGMQVKTKR
jgi:hypothetical protein